MRAKFVNESDGIPWTPQDVTKAKVIGRILTKPMDFGGHHYEGEHYNVVEITETNGHKFYVCDFWYKSGVPQVISDSMVEEYYPV